MANLVQGALPGMLPGMSSQRDNSSSSQPRPQMDNRVLIHAEEKRRQTRSVIEDDLLTKYRNKAKQHLTDLINDVDVKLPLHCDDVTTKLIWKAAGCKHSGEYYINDWLKSHGYKLQTVWSMTDDKLKDAFVIYRHHVPE